MTTINCAHCGNPTPKGNKFCNRECYAQSRIKTQEPPISTPGNARRPAQRFWPEDEPMPTHHDKRPIPCPQCRRVRMDTLSQAVMCLQSGKEKASFRCRCCGNRWILPVQSD